MTARAGLDDGLAAVPTMSIGAVAPFVPCTHIHCSDLRNSLSQLSIALSTGLAAPSHDGPAASGRLRPPAYHGPGVRYRDVIAVLDRALPRRRHRRGRGQYRCGRDPPPAGPRRGGRFLVALGMGGMGYSFGAGVGMAFGRKRRTVVIAGDGAFFMHGMEIHTAVEYRSADHVRVCSTTTRTRCA